mmetsp:Transcript_17005/g.36639  ORF Transcript_17005/g.36639 Transcript_17005/m.36639 type:complete len:235 (-) Transcript_17005:119-823(-)|eukprot:CAMPEP_0206497108 /NCGR_PEP_ID=MMETSP0324_2-20121206/49936_1 /ASSEMBLY_ACC=CAM_ASM_000836 /TAXON_ID=2866 /ORGANISM="Crypthecodinium cohnii, Strain Seligo" /LENGTH=234 /DNA_ID=CAMNT_0053982509 /DNA_START=60 /DNA_END=764 /DNA_ORIENTATION=-
MASTPPVFVDLEGQGDPKGNLGPSHTEQANLVGNSSSGTAPSGGSHSSGVGAVAVGAASASASAIADFFKTAKNPRVCFFHVFFKLAAFLAYFIGRNFIGNYVLTFISTVVLCAFDFWTVKNITGRLLVGMRWWNDIKEDGSSQWYFECNADESTIDAKDRTIFWSALYAWPLLWLVLVFLNILSWDWLMLILMAFVFAATNVVGYWKCSKDQKRQMADWAKSQAVRAMVSNWF